MIATPRKARPHTALRYIPHVSFQDSAEVSRLLETDLPQCSPPEESTAPRNLPAYLARLYDWPLLSRDEEQLAFWRYNYGKFRVTQAKRTEHVRYYTQLAKEARDLLICANLRLVVSLARRFVHPTDGDFFELVSEGNIALLRALESFDISQGVKFSTYATTAIRRHYYHLRVYQQRQRTRFTSGVEVDDAAEDGRQRHDGSYDPESLPVERALLGLVQRLEPRERLLVAARFGLNPGTSERSFTDLGSELGVSKERVRQIVNRALDKLRLWAKESQLEAPTSLA